MRLAGLFAPLVVPDWKESSMAFDLYVLESETRDATVEFGGQTLDVVYKPNVITTEFAEKMQSAENDGNVGALADGANQMLEDWDLVRNTGTKDKPKHEKVELSLKTLKGLPLSFLGAIFAACMEDATAGEDTKNE